jgi:hypothetical protein
MKIDHSPPTTHHSSFIIMSGIATALQALIAPFSPLRRNRAQQEATVAVTAATAAAATTTVAAATMAAATTTTTVTTTAAAAMTKAVVSQDEGGGAVVPPSKSGGVVVPPPESAATSVAEERKLPLLESALHVSMARAQRALYQEKINEAKEHGRSCKEHSERTYTFVVDYGQNMELPVYNANQPGCTYYFSPLSAYNLGMVNHAHKYENGEVTEHMYAHIYHEGVGKKGANNVASLVLKTLRQLNLLRDDSVGGELNIIFDNCSGQNKNNTVLKLAAWLKAAGYFKKVNFVFLVVGHTKNAADCLFNSLKHEYRKQDLFTMEQLIGALSASDCVSVIPTVPEDFYDYDMLFKDLYRPLSGKVKQNHIFTCLDDDKMILRDHCQER